MKFKFSLRHVLVLTILGVMTPPLAYAMHSYGGSPEPGNLALLGLGLIALGSARRKARKAAKLTAQAN